MISGSHAPRARISACLIAQNEQQRLPDALDSVSFCDEIVVVDGGSTDRTVEIARDHGAKVVENPWPGFAAQRNVALDAATSEWVLELDCDERVTPELRASIEALLVSPPDGIAIAVCPLRHWFLGRLLEHAGKYPAYRSRVFKRESYRHDESRTVHEGLEPRERPVLLDGDLEHELATTLGEALRDAWSYAALESEHLQRSSSPEAYLKGIVLRPATKFAYRTVIDKGWRDGWQGVLKILLDVSSDAAVWTRVLLHMERKPGHEHEHEAGRRPEEDASNRHFGRRPNGAPKVVALAGKGTATDSARDWLSTLRARGFDVTLISEDPGPTGEPPAEIPVRIVNHLLPIATMRALDVEMQVRTIRAVVPFGWRAKLVWRLLPRTLRPVLAGLSAETDPLQVEDVTSTADNVIL